jgi:hypothetical protein
MSKQGVIDMIHELGYEHLDDTDSLIIRASRLLHEAEETINENSDLCVHETDKDAAECPLHEGDSPISWATLEEITVSARKAEGKVQVAMGLMKLHETIRENFTFAFGDQSHLG